MWRGMILLLVASFASAKQFPDNYPHRGPYIGGTWKLGQIEYCVKQVGPHLDIRGDWSHGVGAIDLDGEVNVRWFIAGSQATGKYKLRNGVLCGKWSYAGSEIEVGESITVSR